MTHRRLPTLLLCVVAGAGCGTEAEGDEHHHGEGGEGEESSATDVERAEQLLASLADDYRGFARAPGWQTPRTAGTSPHHGAFLDIYVNDVLAQASAGGGAAPWPDGSTIVKDGWSDADGTMLKQIAILEKDGAAWFGAEYDADGNVLEAGTHFEECNGCHDEGSDYLLAL